MQTPPQKNWTAWCPLLGLVAGNLAACGGGGGTTPYEAPVVPTVVFQPNVPVPIQTRSLHYTVYGSATSVPATALATVHSPHLEWRCRPRRRSQQALAFG